MKPMKFTVILFGPSAIMFSMLGPLPGLGAFPLRVGVIIISSGTYNDTVPVQVG